MTALYPSTSAAQVFVPLPVRLSTTGGSAPIAPDVAPDVADCRLIITNPTGGSVCNALVDVGTLPTGITFISAPSCIVVTLDASKFTTAGVYAVTLDDDVTANYQTSLTSFQWGGWVDTLFANQTSIISGLAAIELQTDQAVAILSASYDVDDPAAPTVQTLSIGGSPIATRTIANADGSPINPAQVLILGELTAVP